MTTLEKTVPHNIEAEEAVLGALLIDPEGIFRVLPFLRAEDFYLQKHRWIYEAIVRIHDRRDPIDFLTLTTELEQREQLEAVGGAVYISQLINAVPSAINIESYGKLVEQTAVRRRLLDAVSDIARLAYDEKLPIEQVVDKSEQALFGVSQQRATRDLQPIQEVVQRYYDRVEYLYAHRGEPMGVPTGFRDLDRILGGFQRSDLLILAARPGVGKTSLMLTFALKAAEKGRTVAIFSLEMSAEQLAQRMVAAISQIDAQRLRLGQLQDDEWPRFADAIGHLSDLPIYIDDTPSISVLQLRTKCRRLASERPLEMVFVDYLQLMNSDVPSDNRVQEVSYISRSLKGIARELDIPLMTASQLSRAVEQRADKRPVLSDLRESGCLTGETLVQLADGQRVPIRDLAQENHPAEVMAFNERTGKLQLAQMSRAWYTGVKPVFRLVTRLGREIRASGNHQFLTIEGWKRLDVLKPGEHIALPRTLSIINASGGGLSDAQAALLGHLLGDGCTLPRHAVQYTTNSKDLAELVADLANEAFKETVNPRIVHERQWWQVYLSASEKLTHGKRNPVAEWLDDLGVWGHRSYEKRIPAMMSQREFQAALNMQYCGTALYKTNLSRERALRVGQIVASEELVNLAQNDIYWDKIVSIEPDGEEDVYDLTVPEYHNFVAGDIIVHNSLEQDADIVMFIYREELYNEHTENPNIADIMIAKHRSGPTGTVQLYFNKRLTQFLDAATHVSPDDYGG